MAFMRYATAQVTQPLVTQKGWRKVRKASAKPGRNLVSQATEILGKPFNPDDYLLTHATIVASVDVEEVPNVRLGRVKVGSKTINRKYGDYHIKPECSQFVNNNGDSWSREVLLASYPTFIGAHNFLEHVQIEEQSKGRIIDAVARDLGDSVYVDILIATDRCHEQLVKDIESGKIATLSMGCSVEETICTKCGNVAVDETDLCDCIKYAKLNTFIDDQGQKRVIAELCGHPSIEENAGNTFIEASWVASPAFTGAVLRNIVDVSSMPASMARRIQAVLESMPQEWDENAQRKAASLATREQIAGWGDDDAETEEAAPTPAPAEAEKPKLDQLVDEVYDAVRERVKEKADDDLRKKKVDKALNPGDSSMAPNDTIVKEGTREMMKAAARIAYRGSVKALMRTAASDVAFVDGLASMNSSFGVRIPVDVYRASVRVGSLHKYKSTGHFLSACEDALGRPLNPADARVLFRIGKMLTLLGSTTTRPSQGDGHHGRS